jgi:outer membrane biosynthesis protein TonB
MKTLVVAVAFSFLPLLTVAGQISTEGRGYDSEPTVVSKPNIKLPREAKTSGIGGVMLVRVSLDTAGSVVSVDSVSGPGAVCQHVDREDVRALRESAKEAALHTKFAPLTSNDVATATLSFEVKGERDNFVNSLISGYELPPNRGDEKHFSAVNAPPTDYRGPVSVVGQSETGTDKGEGSNTQSKALPGGVLNGKATSLPKPTYPPAARAVRATGSVPVQVLIDEDGKVFLARATGGHPLLRTAATRAACEASFSPTLLSGEPVKVSGIITYNFVR